MLTRPTIVVIAMLMITASLAAQKNYRGAEVYSKEEVLYGKFKMSMKMIRGSGMLSTFFTYKGDSYYPGVFWEEIDIEILGKEDATVYSTNIITDGLTGNVRNDVAEYHLDYSLADTFHTYTLEWTPDSVVWYIDSILVRREKDAVVHTLTSPQGYRFNAWISCAPSWVGNFNRNSLPQHQYVDWIEYSSYDSNGFTFEWRDDFNSFDNSRWSKADWTFDCNEVVFSPENVSIEDGKLVISLTDPNPINTAVNTLKFVEYAEILNNRSSRELQVKLHENGQFKLQLFNLQGKMLFQDDIVGDRRIIPYEAFIPGLYIMTIQTEDYSVAGKIFL